MSQLVFTIGLKGRTIQTEILREFAKHMDFVLNTVNVPILPRVQKAVDVALESSATWRAINSGFLNKLLLIPAASASLGEIKKTIIEGITIDRGILTIVGNELKSSFSVSLLKDDYGDITSLASGSYMTANSKLVTWLNWLLFYGTEPVLYRMKLVASSRGTLMVTAPNDLAIPAAYAGIKDDNFLTQALKPLEDDIGKIIEEEVSRRA